MDNIANEPPIKCDGQPDIMNEANQCLANSLRTPTLTDKFRLPPDVIDQIMNQQKKSRTTA